ncbi:MAG: DUF4878 domain-containing protein [Thermoflavifilum sp.]|nr:DUF4878 domain-containing protein [Thermoflavifilum sp.]
MHNHWSSTYTYSLLLLCLIGSSCHSTVQQKSSYPQTPEQVARAFMNALQAGQYDSAKLYATSDSYQLIDILSSIAESSPQAQKKIQQANIIIQNISVHNDTGYVTYFNQSVHKTEILPIVRQNGMWKIHFLEDQPVFDSLNEEQKLHPSHQLNP